MAIVAKSYSTMFWAVFIQFGIKLKMMTIIIAIPYHTIIYVVHHFNAVFLHNVFLKDTFSTKAAFRSVQPFLQVSLG